jgi:hypothetical protein
MAALDPARNPVATDVKSWGLLMPLNLEEQIIMPDDETAVHLLDHAVEKIVEGALWAEPPLSLQVEPWRAWLRAHESKETGLPCLRDASRTN